MSTRIGTFLGCIFGLFLVAGHVPAASAAWAAAAATAAAQDADAEHFLILDRATSAADAISYHICRAGVIFCLFLLRPSILSKSCPLGTYAR